MIYWHNSSFGKKQIAYWVTTYDSAAKRWSNLHFLQNQREKWKIWTWEKKSILPHFQSQCQYRSGLWGRPTGPKEERTYPPTSHEETRSMVKYKLWLKDWLSHFRSKILFKNLPLIQLLKMTSLFWPTPAFQAWNELCLPLRGQGLTFESWNTCPSLLLFRFKTHPHS